MILTYGIDQIKYSWNTGIYFAALCRSFFFFFLFTDLHIAIVPLPYTLELIPIPATQGVKNMSVGKKKVKWWIAL